MADLPLSQPSPTSQPAHSHSVRIRFPDGFLTTRVHGDSSRSSSISFAPPVEPMLQSRSDNRTFVDPIESRRHIHSSAPDPLPSGNKLATNSPRHHGSRRKKSHVRKSPTLSPLKVSTFIPDFEPNAFSDEYDLYPRILHDVQRALYLQSRRRERMSQQQHPTPDEAPCPTDTSINMSVPCASTSTYSPSPQASPHYAQTNNLPVDVDFSPSTRSVPIHPVPLSSNGGATLDWTGFHSEDERLDRRWSVSKGKRGAKEGNLSSSKVIVEKQEAVFTDKISRIRAEASPPTIRKAAIVSEQLGRRYNILFTSIASGSPVDLAQVARWHADLGVEARAWLDSAEPLTWLKHLDRRGRQRSQWHVSALIIEEYIKSRKGITLSTPQSPAASSPVETSQHPHESGIRRASSPQSDSSPGTSRSKVRLSDGRLSFGPLAVNSHDSLRNPRAPSEEKAGTWRHSVPAPFDSNSADGNPSPYYHQNSSGGLSPTSSRSPFPDFIHRFCHHPAESEEGSSSPFGSQSDGQNDSSPTGHRRKKNKKKGPFNLGEPQLPQELAEEINPSNRTPNDYPPTPPPVDSSTDPISSTYVAPEITVLQEEGNRPDTILSMPTLYRKRSYRSTSLPLTPNIYQILLQSKGELEEDELEKEYELKLRTLEELRNQNHRLRHRMQRVAIDVREYELVCASVMPTLGIAYRSLPMELLDTLSHDPSAVTSGTRKRRGWRVVEDIHSRVHRQREIVASFLSEMKTDADATSVSENILDQPITTLMEKLQALEREREPLQEQADEVSQRLVEVRASHSAVKEEYNDALSYTSVVYPQLSQIVALEESYKDQYQQVWELGLDALTVILDTITPFWRSYGKIIGEDMQDFVIIPWYRNEFTGEPKRYAVLSVPRRSLRHWVALLCLVALTFIVTFLQARAAITSASHYRLSLIDNQAFRWAFMPFFWVVILIQWLALIFEFCIVLLHIAVVAWWLGWFVGICT